MINYCNKCGTKIEGAYKFCPACGKSLNQTFHIKPAFIATFLASTIALVAIPLGMSSSMIGTSPMDTATENDAGEAISDKIIASLKQNAEASPQDKEAWRALGQEIFSRFAGSEHRPSNAMALAAVDAFAQVLRIDPNDSAAMLALADISFAQQAFSKAAEFYAKYMVANPKDLTAKSKHASSLTFLGQSEQAVKELKEILAEAPNDFHALAYLAITYAQMGKKEESISVGAKAIAVAPNQEAKDRFSSFLDSLASKPHDAAVKTDSASAADKISAIIGSSPIAGPKMVGVTDLGKGEFSVAFKDFPMDKMPPFAKQKFFDSLTQQLRSIKEIKRLSFVDAASKQSMDKLDIAK